MLNYKNLITDNMKKLFFAFILLNILAIHSYGQKSRDVVYLKNGSIVYGTLTEVSDNQFKIKTTDGSLFIFSVEEVDKFIRDEPFTGDRRSEGIGISLEGGFLIGSQSGEYPSPFSFNALINYTFNTKHLLGIGTGAEFIGKTYTPLFLEYRVLLNEKNVAPYIFMRGGMVLYLGEDEDRSDNYYPPSNYSKKYSGGASFTIGTGISWAKNEFEKYLSFAYRYLNTSYTETTYNNLPVTYESYFNRLEIKFGFKF